jgi:hypothetical protein
MLRTPLPGCRLSVAQCQQLQLDVPDAHEGLLRVAYSCYKVVLRAHTRSQGKHQHTSQGKRGPGAAKAKGWGGGGRERESVSTAPLLYSTTPLTSAVNARDDSAMACIAMRLRTLSSI